MVIMKPRGGMTAPVPAPTPRYRGCPMPGHTRYRDGACGPQAPIDGGGGTRAPKAESASSRQGAGVLGRGEAGAGLLGVDAEDAELEGQGGVVADQGGQLDQGLFAQGGDGPVVLLVDIGRASCRERV